MQRWQLFKIYGQLLPLLVLSLTAITLPSCTTTQPAKPFSSETLPTEAIAEISEIRSYPVRIKYVNGTSARPATVGASLKVNESVSTEESSTAQLTLRSGTIIRIGGNSSLTVKPQNQVEIISGRLVAWSDRKAPVQIKTPFGEISSNDGTVYLEIPPKASDDRRIIALDGTVTFLLTGSSAIVTLGKGEEIRIKADGKASAPKRIDKEGIDKRIANNALIFGFSTQLASLPQIASEFGVTSTIKEASTIQFRRSDLPKKPNENDNSPKVTYSSGSSANSDRNDRNDRNDRQEEPVERRREEPSAAKSPEKTLEPASTNKQSEPPANSTTEPKPIESTPITTNPTATPVQPSAPPSAPLEPVPLEPPPQPVQPEIPAPEPALPKPPKSR